jgi:hypothetical protein
MNDDPVDLDKHRDMAAQKATDIRRVLADVEANAKLLRDRQGVVEIQLFAVRPPHGLRRGRVYLNIVLTACQNDGPCRC